MFVTLSILVLESNMRRTWSLFYTISLSFLSLHFTRWEFYTPHSFGFYVFSSWWWRTAQIVWGRKVVEVIRRKKSKTLKQVLNTSMILIPVTTWMMRLIHVTPFCSFLFIYFSQRCNNFFFIYCDQHFEFSFF